MSSLIEIQNKIAELQAQASEIRSRELGEKIAQIKETMSTYGITVEQLQGKPAKTPKQAGSKSANPAAPKYIGPNGEQYSGRGLTPRWLAALIAEGHDKSEYLIKK